ncbi:MAG: molybdenum cofactor biosynthesis protein MoaE [Actinobacteria bacterium]|nr:MAG: molybdenum cofactor biosynthesis protein MoaE [Actinomycetota bacterium]
MGAVSDDQTLVRITAEPLSVDEALAFIADPSSGGSCIFVGTVRDADADGVVVTGLTYESWNDVAVDRLHEIADRLRDRWQIRKVALFHRTGDLGVGDASVVVAVSSPHRAEAFEACREGIEQLKHDVPIWKKELLATGEGHWVIGA